MAATIRISARAARALMASPDIWATGAARKELEAALDALDRKRTKQRPRRLAVKEARKTKKEARAEVREAVMIRSEGNCEGCGATVMFGPPLQMDHFFGVARHESVETCWALCVLCHRGKTDNIPSAEHWLRRFLKHCDKYNYGSAAREASKRLAFVETRQAFAEAAKP